jgi:release factor glutamine methyltransferase
LNRLETQNLAHGSVTVRTALLQATSRLASASSNPHLDADLLLRHVLQKNRAWVLAHPDVLLQLPEQKAYASLIARRAAHEPVQYITGEQEFYGLRLIVTPAVLIPRPETEHLVQAVLDWAATQETKALRVADIGTGSGAIAIALAHTQPLLDLDAVDLSHSALQIAKSNASAHGVAGRIRFVQSDLLHALADVRFDAIVANPPYIPAAEMLEAQVTEWEPHLALFAGADGLSIFRRLIPEASAVLKDGGLLAMEIGAGEQSAVEALLTRDGYWEQPQCLSDLQGIPRVVLARRRNTGR